MPFLNSDTVPDTVGYVLYANHTDKRLEELALPLQRTLEESLLAQRVGNDDVRISASWREMPRGTLRIAGYDVVAANGAQWFYVPSMIVFLMLLVEIVSEKERKLRVGMLTMGLKNSVFWLVW